MAIWIGSSLCIGEWAEPLAYSQVLVNKVKPPKEGCLVGFYKLHPLDDPIISAKIREITQKAKNIDEFADALKRENLSDSMEKGTTDNINYYKHSLNAEPSILVIHTAKLYLEFPTNESTAVIKRGIVPYLSASPGVYASSSLRFSPKEIAQGQCDNYIKKFAQGATEFGKEHGGFFFTTMIEFNGRWWYWGQSSNFIPAWRRIWQLFEEQGANQYATWVWEAYCPEGVPSFADNPELYYPGDKYVDWIGLNAYSQPRDHYINDMFDRLMYRTYKQMLKKHPQKPIMQSQFGKSNGHDQSKWLIKAYRSIKTDFPAIKAAIYYDSNNKIVDPTWTDATLTPKSLETLKEIFKDPYWIVAK